MRTKRSALLGLVLGLAVFGAACEDKTEVVIPPEPDPPIVVTVTPQQLTMEVGQSATLAAAVTGGAAGTAKTVTWSSSNSGVASVDASGNVTAVAAGIATVTATSTADAAAKAAAAITVTAPPPPAVPSVSIKSITQFATTIPVALNNVFGQIDITLNLDVPTGAQVSALRTYVNNTKVCEQTFSSPELGTEEVNEAADVICSVNTAAYTGTPGVDAAATITFPNGPGYKVRAEIVDPTGTISAQIESADLIFNNPSFIVAEMKAPTNCTTGALLGGATFWCEGDVMADFLPVTFSTNANDAINSVTMTEVNLSGATATDAAAPWSITLQKASSPGASSVGGVEGVAALTVFSTTAGGQTGTACINPDPVLNPIGFCAVGAWVVGTGGLPTTAFLLDNRSPTITLFDITPGTICVGSAAPACYVNGAFAFSVRTGFFAHNDAGVGSPTAVFMAGLPGAEVTVTSGADMAESATAQTYVIKATSTDKLGNSVTRWAGVNPVAPTTSATSGSTQMFGIDKTIPTHVVTWVANGAVNALPPAIVGPVAASAAYTDAGVGPSGFLANPVSIKIELTNATGTTCHNPDTGAAVSCTTNGGYVPDDGTFTFLGAGPIPDGYLRVSIFVTDQAGNVSATQVIEVLNDVTAPSFTGGIVAPATIAGGAAVAFSSALADGVDLGSLLPYIGYGPGAGFLAWPNQAIGTFGPASLATTDPGNVSIGAFIRSVQTNNGAGLPSGTIFPATSVTYAIRDMAGHQLRYVIEPWTAAPNDGLCPPAIFPDPGSATQNCATRQLDITANVAAPLGGIFPDAYNAGAAVTNCTALSNCDLVGLNGANALHGLFVMQAPSNAVICNDASGSNCPTLGNNATTTTLTVTLTGPVSVFTSPFSEVQFRFADPALGPDMYIGSAGAPSITDNTVTSTRTITWTMVWNAETMKVRPAGAGTAYTVYALGRNATGDALFSTPVVVTVEGN